MNFYQKEFLPYVVYQIYPKSFCDLNGDGLGDIKGVESKIEYLKNLGINAVWFSPCFPSPNVDNGYDISDYRDIDSYFGNLEEFKALIEKLHNNGIKVILDFVANHTSDKHKWFEESKKSRDNAYSDYYYWADKPINRWPSHNFGESVWEYCPDRDQYYLHSFAKEQPDLNWTNPKVRQEMKEVVCFWVDLGVDGFRCDVLDMISKDFSLQDGRGNGNGPMLDAYLNELFGDEKLKHVFTVGECWGVSMDRYRQVCEEERKELKCSFSFGHILKHIGESRFIQNHFHFNEMAKEMYQWVEETQEDLLYPLVLENHDQPRIVSKYGDEGEFRYESATMLATFTYFLKGIPFIYQGQEIGLTNPKYPDISYFNDIETVNYYKANVEQKSLSKLMEEVNFGNRDNGRRMMPWNDKRIEKAWLFPYNEAEKINVEKDLNSEKSVYKYYQKILRLRRENQAFIYGDFQRITMLDNGINVYERNYKGERFLIVVNYKDQGKVRLPHANSYKILLSNYARESVSQELSLSPYEALVLKIQ